MTKKNRSDLFAGKTYFILVSFCCSIRPKTQLSICSIYIVFFNYVSLLNAFINALINILALMWYNLLNKEVVDCRKQSTDRVQWPSLVYFLNSLLS